MTYQEMLDRYYEHVHVQAGSRERSVREIALRYMQSYHPNAMTFMWREEAFGGFVDRDATSMAVTTLTLRLPSSITVGDDGLLVAEEQVRDLLKAAQ